MMDFKKQINFINKLEQTHILKNKRQSYRP
jgi:hypothetical protein